MTNIQMINKGDALNTYYSFKQVAKVGLVHLKKDFFIALKMYRCTVKMYYKNPTFNNNKILMNYLKKLMAVYNNY